MFTSFSSSATKHTFFILYFSSFRSYLMCFLLYFQVTNWFPYIFGWQENWQMSVVTACIYVNAWQHQYIWLFWFYLDAGGGSHSHRQQEDQHTGRVGCRGQAPPRLDEIAQSAKQGDADREYHTGQRPWRRIHSQSNREETAGSCSG